MSDIRINIDKRESWNAALHRFDKGAVWIDVTGVEIGMTREQARDLVTALLEALAEEEEPAVKP